MEVKDTQILKKIDEHAKAVLSYCSECKELNDFQNNSMRVEACVFNLMQIGELAKTSLSDDAKQVIKTIPWNQIYGMRNRIVHGYSGVNMQIIWDVITDDLPKLVEELEKYI